MSTQAPPQPKCPPAAPPAPAAPISASTKTGLIIAGVVWGIIVIALGYKYFFKTEGPITPRIMSWLIYSVVSGVVIFGIFFFVIGISGNPTASGNLAPKPVDYAAPVTVSGASLPLSGGSTNGGNYGLQWWMYIKDWNYKFGQEKPVITRGAAGGLNPYVYLHPTDNSLCVKINVFSGSSGAGQSSSPAPVGAGGAATDDSYVCKIDNVPLQAWFCINLSVEGRNVDIYLNGMLVRSCLLPGVPKNPVGDLQIMPGGGFSGNVIDVYHHSRALKPNEAKAFCMKGTNGTGYNELPSKPLFGYSVKFSINDSTTGQQIKQYTL